jgi:23S rRNA pseudouridine2605 synthase
MPMERLQKILAAAGVASRRKAEEMILKGMVTVNGTVITEMGTKADPATDRIKVGNKVLLTATTQEFVYILLHKPKGFVTTVSDPEKRPTVMNLVAGVKTRIYPVGRLDYASEGLLLMTNDGDLAHKLTHASSGVEKTYLVKISGHPDPESIDRLRGGVSIARGNQPGERVRTATAKIELAKSGENPWYAVTLIEGRNRQIRKMFEEVGHHVEKIKRVRYGPLELDIETGEYRHLSPKEIVMLKRAASPRPAAPPSVRPQKPTARPKK